MSALDIVSVPGYPGQWARRCVVEAWVAAGSPPLDGAGRTYEQQKWFYERWKAGVGNAADNPDAPTRQPHVRGMALDLRVWNTDVVRRMRAAGFVRPITIRRGTPWPDGRGGFSQDEGWHFELEQYVDRIYTIPKVTAAVAGQATPFEEDDMTPEQATQLDAVYKALYGPNNGPAAATRALGWRDIDGAAKSARYGALDIVIHNQQLIAQQAGKLNGLAEAVAQLQGGGQVNMGAITAAAEAGARDALSRLTITVED